MDDNAGSGSSGKPVMTRGRLRDLTATFLRGHEDVAEVAYTNPPVGDTLGLVVTATDRVRFRMWVAYDHTGP